MTTDELVRRIVQGGKPVTKERAQKIARHLERPAQLDAVLARLSGVPRKVVKDTLTPTVLERHFQGRK